jgi:octaprenyl-diphosphate synthase
MTTTVAALTSDKTTELDLLGRLEGLGRDRGLGTLADTLEDLRCWISRDLADVEQSLCEIDGPATPMCQSARHLLDLGGKRLRPMCVALASRVGEGFCKEARELAVAAELVHSATLLHDDVVDLGDFRRGAPTARMVYGNAASVFAGDWLLVEAIRRIRRTGFSDVLDRALGVLDEMLMAESLQLERRGRVRANTADYFRVVEGKTASLFRWALFAGGRAGGAPIEWCTALEGYGQRLGVAFQLVDDVLDVAGDAAFVGKGLFADLREGKMTYPLLLAVERDPGLGAVLETDLPTDGSKVEPALQHRVAVALRETRAVEESLAVARKYSEEAVAGLGSLPAGRAKDALKDVALMVLHRRK